VEFILSRINVVVSKNRSFELVAHDKKGVVDLVDLPVNNSTYSRWAAFNFACMHLVCTVQENNLFKSNKERNIILKLYLLYVCINMVAHLIWKWWNYIFLKKCFSLVITTYVIYYVACS
jgi:hypothetical protein